MHKWYDEVTSAPCVRRWRAAGHGASFLMPRPHHHDCADEYRIPLQLVRVFAHRDFAAFRSEPSTGPNFILSVRWTEWICSVNITVVFMVDVSLLDYITVRRFIILRNDWPSPMTHESCLCNLPWPSWVTDEILWFKNEFEKSCLMYSSLYFPYYNTHS